MSARDPEQTDPYGSPPPSDPQDDAPERFAKLVAAELDQRVVALVTVEAATRKAVRDLADAFHVHTTDESKRHAAMMKVLAVKSVTPTVALVVAVLAFAMALGSSPAQASGPPCMPAAGGGP